VRSHAEKVDAMRAGLDPDDSSLPRSRRIVESRLDREGGVLIEPNARRVSCNSEDASCAPDSYFEDPYGDDSPAVPGTVDDLPLDYGTQVAVAADEHLSVVAPTRPSVTPAPEEEAETEISKRDEHELWAAQKPLIAEDTATGLRLDGFPEDKIPMIMKAMGDDAADPLDTPGGRSATGAWNEPEHGGFPERVD
jgi:hypothetical protein